tara:strand:- start:186 stop:668 length:483 start_codon:yes stop_codon:yes gene_type:complete
MFSKKHISVLNITEKDLKRFWHKVDKGGGTSSECWEWLGAKHVKGYGTFWLKGSDVRCHRLSFFLRTGILDDNLLVCHICDNPGCVNPDHLWLGTLQANNFDRFLKKRTASILTEKDVRDILLRLKNNESRRSIAKMYNISYHTVWDIKAGRSWKHVTLS